MINYIEKGCGLHEEICLAGHWLREEDGVWRSSDDAAVQAIIDAYDPIPYERARRYKEVAAARLSRQAVGMPYAFQDGPGVVQTRDDRDLLNVNGIVTTAMLAKASGQTEAVFGFRDMENETHPMTPDQVIALGLAVSAYVNSFYAAKWAHDAAISQWDGSTSYDISAFWPEV